MTEGTRQVAGDPLVEAEATEGGVVEDAAEGAMTTAMMAVVAVVAGRTMAGSLHPVAVEGAGAMMGQGHKAAAGAVADMTGDVSSQALYAPATCCRCSVQWVFA